MARNHLGELMDLAGRLIDREEGKDHLSVRDHAADMGLPLSTAHRHVTSLVNAGLAQRAGRGRYVPGPALIALAERMDMHATISDLARPLLRELTTAMECTAHLGVLENGMVSYLVKEGESSQIFSREGLQLEAYCSALGKVLLSGLPAEALNAYLAEDAFVALTPHTKVRPDQISAELDDIRRSGFALDLEEICEDLFCLAVPVRGPADRIVAAISVSCFGWTLDETQQNQLLAELRPRAACLSRQLGATPEQAA